MEDPGKIIVAVVAIVAIATTIRTVLLAAFNRRREPERDSMTSLADSRLSRLEQAVDAIALEIERISEGQRFTTKLLAEQARQKNIAVPELPSHTPT